VVVPILAGLCGVAPRALFCLAVLLPTVRYLAADR